MSFSVLKDPRCPEVHASTLLVHQGNLLSAWFGGMKEGHPDTKIWLSRRSLDDETAWSRPEVVASSDGLSHWNPVLFAQPGSTSIALFYKVGSPISTWSTHLKRSLDGGQSWSDSVELVPGDKGGRGPVKNKCLILSNSTILAPASLETPTGRWECFADLSSDFGRTWSRSDPIRIDRTKLLGEGAIQPSLIESSPGRVSMFARSSTGYVLRADSEDYGKTWSEMYETTAENNNSGIDALKLRDDLWLLVHNPVNRNWANQGKSWQCSVVLEDKAPPKGFDRIVAMDTGIVNDGQSEFSYPAIILDGSGGAFISYTYERVGIKHIHLRADQLNRRS